MVRPRLRYSRDVRVAVIGAGVGGIATAYKLKRAGVRDFVVFEQADGAGGTWHDNTYPGCEVDIPSALYSFSFMDWNWSRTHARQPELKAYVEATIDRFGLRPHFRFGARVDAATWSEERQLYTVRLANGEEHEFETVVSCLGLLNHPRLPDWAGCETFRGPQFHTARWRHDIDLRGKRVALVGTGSTACQLLPELAEVAERVFVFQREPAMVYPKGERFFTQAERARARRWRIVRLWRRYLVFRTYSRGIRKEPWRADTRFSEERKQLNLDFLAAEVHDPDVRRALTPGFPPGCKRDVAATTYYAAFNRPNVTLVPHAVERVTETGVVAADGVERELDVLVLATGFQPQHVLATLDVVGRDGVSLHEFWGDSPRAFLGITVPGFPNFFMLYGPNTNGGGSIIYQDERAAEVAVRAVRKLRRGATAVDTRPSQFERYVKWIDDANAAKGTAMAYCNNYYFSASGRNITQWPFTHLKYHLVTRFWGAIGLVTTRAPRPSGAGGRAAEVAA